ncbi:MAG: carboxypeptidase-like regulatory domain-containing protein [archaeon]
MKYKITLGLLILMIVSSTSLAATTVSYADILMARLNAAAEQSAARLNTSIDLSSGLKITINKQDTTVSGQVTYNGGGVAATTVQLFKGGSKVSEQMTAAGGYFTFINVAAGEYIVTVPSHIAGSVSTKVTAGAQAKTTTAKLVIRLEENGNWVDLKAIDAGTHKFKITEDAGGAQCRLYIYRGTGNYDAAQLVKSTSKSVCGTQLEADLTAGTYTIDAYAYDAGGAVLTSIKKQITVKEKVVRTPGEILGEARIINANGKLTPQQKMDALVKLKRELMRMAK